MARMLWKLIVFAFICIPPIMASAEVVPPATYPRPPYEDDKPVIPAPALKLEPSFKAPETYRDGWYVGFGLGTGSGTYTENGSSGKMRGWNSASTHDFPVRYLNFKLGKALTPRILLGHDMSVLRTHSDTECYSTELIVTNYNLVATIYPWKKGFYLRSGGGLSLLLHRDRIPGHHMKKDAGANVLTGLGWAVPVGKSFTMTLGADYSMQRYGGGKGKPNSSQVVAGWVGFDWY